MIVVLKPGYVGLPFSVIAEVFGETESWARVTYHRAKGKISERSSLKIK